MSAAGVNGDETSTNNFQTAGVTGMTLDECEEASFTNMLSKSQLSSCTVSRDIDGARSKLMH